MAQSSRRTLVLRAFTYNVLGLALSLAMLLPIALGDPPPAPFGVLIAGTMFVVSRSSLRPKIAETPFNRRENLVWTGGFVAVAVLAFSLAYSLGATSWESLAFATLGVTTWAFSFLAVRDVHIVLSRPPQLAD